MKRSLLIMITCLCALAFATFGLTACGGDASSSGTSRTTASNGDSSAAEDGEGVDAADLNADEIRGAFQQALTGMSEYYQGTTPVGEQLYYAGGSDGENAVFVLIVPDSGSSVIFIGPVEVGEDSNVLTVTDSTTGSTIAFQVFDNGDGTYSFSMGDEYGAAIMNRCSSAEIIDALTSVVMESANQAASAEGDETGAIEGALQE